MGRISHWKDGERPPPLELPDHFPPVVVDLMLELQNDCVTAMPPQKPVAYKNHHCAPGGSLIGRSFRRQGKSNRGHPILKKEFQPGDVALWIALGYHYKKIAEQLGCAPASVNEYLLANPQVREQAKLIRRELLDGVEGSVVDRAGEAVNKLGKLMESPDEDIALRASNILLTKAFELRPERQKGPLVAIQNNAPSMDLTRIPSETLKEILKEELDARNAPAASQEPREGPPEGSPGHQEPPSGDQGPPGA